jgi:leader peptidase (prepilin peptidase) / N-methyltransferase
MESTITAGSFFTEWPEFFLFYACIISLLVGSFLNVVIHRLPRIMEREWKHDCCELLEVDQQVDASKPYNLVTPNSHCPHCDAPVKPWQNIPIISYMFLRGKCANCSGPISVRYPLVELATGLLSGYIAWQWGATPQAMAAICLTWVLITLTMIDIDTQLLPDSLTLPLLWAGLILNSGAFFGGSLEGQGLFVSLEDALWGAVAGYMVLWSVFWLFKILTGKEGMGFGDFKLLAALGAWMGWQALPLIIILSSLVGAVIGVAGILIMGRDKNIPIPFGPYLAIAGWIALLWGDMITQSYLQFAGIQ